MVDYLTPYTYLDCNCGSRIASYCAWLFRTVGKICSSIYYQRYQSETCRDLRRIASEASLVYHGRVIELLDSSGSSRKLQEITTLTSGSTFTKAWLDVVTCVERITIILPHKIMLFFLEKICQTWCKSQCWQHDVWSWEWLRGADGFRFVPPAMRTSRIRVLAFVFLPPYQDGKRQYNTYATSWMASNYKSCTTTKVYFYSESL